MSVQGYDDLKAHVGHTLVVTHYGLAWDNVAIECEDDNEVLLDFDKVDDDDPMVTVTLPTSVAQQAHDIMANNISDNLFDEDDASDVVRRLLYYAVNVDPQETGHCDVCYTPYHLPSREDHCVEEGTCWQHCDDEEKHHKAQLQELVDIMQEGS